MISAVDLQTVTMAYPTGPRWYCGLTDLVADATAAIAAACQANPRSRTVLVLHGQPTVLTPNHVRLSTKEALRSLVHASVLEQPSLGLALVLAESLEDPDVGHTLDYLSGPHGQFVQGTTIDLLGPT